MGEVDHHAQPVHLADHRLAERRQAVVLRIVGGAVGEVVGGGVRQGHVARAQGVVGPQNRHGIGDLVAAFDPDQRGDAARLVQSDNIVGRVGHAQVGRVARGQGLDDVDLLEGHLHRGRAGYGDRDEHAPELPADHAGAQSRYVGHDALTGRGPGQVGLHIETAGLAGPPAAHLLRKIIVAVDQRRLGEHLRHPRGDLGVRLRR